MALLSIRKLAVSVAGISVCQELGFELLPAQCWAILGPNGVGKTTLLHTLAGLRAPDHGEIVLNGDRLSTIPPRLRAQQIGVLQQTSDDPFPATVMESVLTGRHPHLKPWLWESETDYRIARAALQAVDLTGLEQRSLDTLSGGERRRVAIAALYAQNPGIMLLDEPANHLDMRHQISLMQQLRENADIEQKGIVMVTHDINLAARYCDHAILVAGNGEVRAGTRDEVMSPELLSQVFRHPLTRISDGQNTVWAPR